MEHPTHSRNVPEVLEFGALISGFLKISFEDLLDPRIEVRINIAGLTV